MAGRIAALALAVALIVGAIIIRDRVIEDGGNGSDGGSSSGSVVCASDLPDDVCETEEGVTATFERLLADDTESISWLTIGPWPQMLDEADTASTSRFGAIRVLASTDLVAVVLNRPAQCAQELTWKCLGDAARTNGRVSAPARGTSVRLFARAALLGGFIGRTDYATNDLDEVPGAREWIEEVERGIEQARQRQAGTLSDFLARRGAAADVFITTAAEAGLSAVTAISAPAPRARIDATLGRGGSVDEQQLRDRLVTAGWEPTTGGSTAGLPSPGVLLALRDLES